MTAVRLLLLIAAARPDPVVQCGPPAALAGVAVAFAAHARGIVAPWDGQFFDPTPPAVWPEKVNR